MPAPRSRAIPIPCSPPAGTDQGPDSVGTYSKQDLRQKADLGDGLTLEVRVEMTPEMFTDNMGEIQKRQKQLVDGLKSMLGIKANVSLVAPKSITRSEGKAVRVIDNRKI